MSWQLMETISLDNVKTETPFVDIDSVPNVTCNTTDALHKEGKCENTRDVMTAVMRSKRKSSLMHDDDPSPRRHIGQESGFLDGPVSPSMAVVRTSGAGLNHHIYNCDKPLKPSPPPAITSDNLCQNESLCQPRPIITVPPPPITEEVLENFLNRYSLLPRLPFTSIPPSSSLRLTTPPFTCVSCRHNCNLDVSGNDRKLLNIVFQSLKKHNKRYFILRYVKRVAKAEGGMRSLYSLKNAIGERVHVCKKFFLTTLGFNENNDKFVRNTLKRVNTGNNGSCNLKTGGSYNPRKWDLEDIAAHIKSYRPRYTKEIGPTRRHLQGDITVKKMYLDFRDKGNSISYATFFRFFKKMDIDSIGSKPGIGGDACDDACQLFSENHENAEMSDEHSSKRVDFKSHKKQRRRKGTPLKLSPQVPSSFALESEDQLDSDADILFSSSLLTSPTSDYADEEEELAFDKLGTISPSLQRQSIPMTTSLQPTPSQLTTPPLSSLQEQTTALSDTLFRNESQSQSHPVPPPPPQPSITEEELANFLIRYPILHPTPPSSMLLTSSQPTTTMFTCRACRNNCHADVSTTDRKLLNIVYQTLTWHEKRLFIVKSVTKMTKADGAACYMYTLKNAVGESIRVCKKFFLTTLGFHKTNDKVIKNTLKHVDTDLNSRHWKLDFQDGRGKSTKIRTYDVNELTAHIESYGLHHALSGEISVKKMYSDFIDKGNSLSYTTFYRFFKKMDICSTKFDINDCKMYDKDCKDFEIHSDSNTRFTESVNILVEEEEMSESEHLNRVPSESGTRRRKATPSKLSLDVTSLSPLGPEEELESWLDS